jgi:hypothetical protein
VWPIVSHRQRNHRLERLESFDGSNGERSRWTARVFVVVDRALLCRDGRFVEAKLVPERGVRWRFVHVLRRDDFSRGWHFRPLLGDFAVVLFTASGKLFVLYSAAL